MISFTFSHLIFGMAVLAGLLIVLIKQKQSFWYLFFFSIFWLYLLGLVSVIVFPIVPLSPEHPFAPRVNLIPFSFGRCDMPELCLRTIFQNILMTVPFGFGLPFIVRLKPKDFFWLAPLIGITLEATQLILSFVFRSAFRAVDINDVILNAVGVWSGYLFFRILGRLYLDLTQRFEWRHRSVFGYMYDVIRQSTVH